jgi:hypothetical protein
MNEAVKDARGTIPAGSGDVPPGTDLPRGGRDRGAAPRRCRRRRRMRVLVAAAVPATAALLVACAGNAPSPLTAVTSAVAQTSAAGYSFTLDFTVHVAGRELRSVVVSGAFDPGHELGAELLTAQGPNPATARIRFMGKYVYTCVSSPGSKLGTPGKPWDKAPVPPAGADAMPGNDVYGFVSDQPVSPAELSAVLGSAGTVRDEGSASGPGWTGTRYTFTAHFLDGRESVTATVYVDQHGQVRRLVTITTQGRVTTDRNLTFVGFGVPTAVTAPPAAQTVYTSQPYWGFLF